MSKRIKMEETAENPDTLRDELFGKMGETGDVIFLVGSEEEEVKAFTFLLRSLSPVFETMFDDKWKSSVVKVPEIEAKIFRLLLKLLLTDSSRMDDLMELESELELSVVETVDLLYAANKYDVKKVQQACARTIQKNLKVGIVATTYEALKLINEPELEAVVLKFITENLTELMTDETFNKLSAESLTKILNESELCVDELTLFNGVYSWAKFRCEQGEREVNAENIRDILGPLLFLVRFPLMSQKEFFKHVFPTGILSPEEVIGISQAAALKDDQDAPLFTTPFDTRQREAMFVKLFSFTPKARTAINGLFIVGPDELFAPEKDVALGLHVAAKDSEPLVLDWSRRTETEKLAVTQGTTGLLWNSVLVMLPKNIYHFRSRFPGFKAVDHSRLISFMYDGDRLEGMRLDMICKTTDGKVMITENEMKMDKAKNLSYNGFMYHPSEEISIEQVEIWILSDRRKTNCRAYLWISEVETGLDVVPRINCTGVYQICFPLDVPLSMKPQHTYHFGYDFPWHQEFALVAFEIENGDITIKLRQQPA